VTDLLIRGEALDLAIEDGRIAAVGPELPGPAREEIDARGLLLLPGAVDAHVHFNEPGRTDWEGWDTGTRALAAGGTTVGIEMPLNAHPPTNTAAAFDAKLAAAQRSAYVDFALWGGLVPGNLEHLEELAARGVVGFKAFMSASGVDDFERADEETLYEGMQKAAALGLPVAVHAESEAITSGLTRRALEAGRTGVRDYLASRPIAAELEAIATALALAEDTGCSLHVVHVSTGRGVALVADARSRGVDASCETCPHYLVFDDDDAERLGAIAKCAPPLRPRAEVDALWAALKDGSLPMVASDHSPSPASLKHGTAFEAWGGISGCQTMLAAVWGPLAPEVLGERLAGFPARRFGLQAKGRLEVGADADVVLVRVGADHVLSDDELLYRHRHSPFVGRTLRARIVRTILRGRTVWDGRIAGEPTGRLVVPET
jgi:allantoinase